MIPAPPALGDSLYADAAVLRPAVPGMRWTYAGVRKVGAVIDRYDSDSRMESGTAGALIEKGWQVFEGGNDSSTLSVANGTVTSSESIDLGAAVAETISGIELRSPVRVNDQITVLERFGAATGFDIDGDKKADTADLAFYRRVIGNEDVELPALGQTVRALRVDDTAIFRFHRSGDGGTAAPITTTGSTWYAPGIGIVRRTLSEPVENGQTQQYDEKLQAFDGLTTGRGGLLHTRPDQPQLQGLLGQTLVASAAIGDRVLVLSRHAPAGGQPELRLAVLDASGRVTSSRVLEGVSPNQSVEPLLVGSETQALLVVRETVVRADPYVHYQLRAWRFDAAGQLAGPAGGTVLPLDEMHYAGSYRIAAEGGRWWALWQGGTADGQIAPISLQLQGFDGTTLQPVTARHLLESGSTFPGPSIAGLSAAPGRVAAVWRGGASGAEEFRLAQVAAGGSPRVAVLGRASNSSASLGFDNPTPLTLMDDGRSSLYWTPAAFSPFGSPTTQMRGVVVDGEGVAIRTASAGLDDELLPPSWVIPAGNIKALGGAGAQLLGSWGYTIWRSGDTLTTSVLQLTQPTPASGGGLANALAVIQRWRGFDTLYGPNGSYGIFTPMQWVRLKDRVLVIGDDLRTVGVAFLR
jgi:hypothetical protein